MTLEDYILRLVVAGAALLGTGIGGMTTACLAQVPAAPASAKGVSASEKHPKFEVVSIKRHTTDGPPVQTGPTPEGFRSIGVPLF